MRARLALELSAPELAAPATTPVDDQAPRPDEDSPTPPAVTAPDRPQADDPNADTPQQVTAWAELVFLPPGVAAEPGQLDLSTLFAEARSPRWRPSSCCPR